MNFSEYQKAARRTAVYPKSYRVVYPVLGLCGETGEVAEKVKKQIRDGSAATQAEVKGLIALELGDVLWYLANLAEDLGYSLEWIAAKNLEKLSSRMKRGKLHGEGDER